MRLVEYGASRCARHPAVKKKDGGIVTIQEVGARLVCHCYLADPCQQARFKSSQKREREREAEREAERKAERKAQRQRNVSCCFDT